MTISLKKKKWAEHETDIFYRYDKFGNISEKKSMKKIKLWKISVKIACNENPKRPFPGERKHNGAL